MNSSGDLENRQRPGLRWGWGRPVGSDPRCLTCGAGVDAEGWCDACFEEWFAADRAAGAGPGRRGATFRRMATRILVVGSVVAVAAALVVALTARADVPIGVRLDRAGPAAPPVDGLPRFDAPPVTCHLHYPLGPPGAWCTPGLEAMDCANGVTALTQRRRDASGTCHVRTVIYPPGHPEALEFMEAR